MKLVIYYEFYLCNYVLQVWIIKISSNESDEQRTQPFDPLMPSGHLHRNPLDRFISNKYITKTRLYNFDPLKPHFYIVKLGFTGVYIIFSYFCSKT